MIVGGVVEPSDELKALDLLEKPGARESPIVFYCGKRNVENLSDFLIRAAAKITQLHDLGLNRIFLGEFVQRFMHGQQFIIGLGGDQIALIEINTLISSTVAASASAARPINQNAAHRFGGGGKKVSAVLKARVL